MIERRDAEEAVIELDERASERILRKTKVYDRYTRTIIDDIIEVDNPDDIEDDVVIEIMDASEMQQ